MTNVNPIDELTARVLREHQRSSISACDCGWGGQSSELGKLHSMHIVQKLREAGVLKEIT